MRLALALGLGLRLLSTGTQAVSITVEGGDGEGVHVTLRNASRRNALNITRGDPRASMLTSAAARARVLNDPAFIEATESCSFIDNAQDCVERTELGLATCSYCARDNSCHAFGSTYNPCPSYCCASHSMFSDCKFSESDDITFTDGKCAAEGTPTNTSAYDPPFALDMLQFARVAYCTNTKKIRDWDCNFCKLTPPAGDVTIVIHEAQNVFAYVAETAKYNIVAFRGTQAGSIKNWISNLDYFQVFPYADNPSLGVHEGFFKDWNLVKEEVRNGILKLPKKPIHLVGHSLGAALSTLAAFDLAREGFPIGIVHTFGSPRVGNYQFIQAYEQKVKNHWRLTHNNDLVPHVPREEQGFYHTHTEVYYKDDSASVFYVCNDGGEDIACSDKCSLFYQCLSVSDHLVYMGLSIGSVC